MPPQLRHRQAQRAGPAIELALVQEPGKERQGVGAHKPQALVRARKGQKIPQQQQRHDFAVAEARFGAAFALPQMHAMLLIPVIHQDIHNRRPVCKGYTGYGEDLWNVE